MGTYVLNQMNTFLKQRKRHEKWLAFFLVLAVCVSLITLRQLRLEGVALNHKDMELHCTVEGPVAHVHNEDCYDADGELRCPLPELELHIHTSQCYEDEMELVCPLEESEGHVHDASCYTRVRSDEPICGIDDEDHVHTDTCYDYEELLTCGLEEGEGEHVHTIECYELEEVLCCGKEEITEVHIHSDACFDMTSDQVAQLAAERGTKIEENWRVDVEALQLSGVWADDIVTVARSQLGYEQGEAEVSRYNEWYGGGADDWDASFVSFCLHFGGVSARAVPRSDDPAAWQSELVHAGLWCSFDEYDPEPGDLLFVRLYEGSDTDAPDHVAVFSGFGRDADGAETIKAIERRGDAVLEWAYDADDSGLLGFVRIPDAKEWKRSQRSIEMPAQTFIDECGGIRVTVEADAGAFPFGTQMVLAPVAAEDVFDVVSGAVEGRISGVEAVDITFIDANGQEIEPLIPIRVLMAAPRIAHAENPQVVHVDSEGEATLVAQKLAAQLDEPPAGDEVVFDADGFSVYAIVYTIERYYTDCQGETWRIVVDYGPDAGLPEDVVLNVTELKGDDAALYLQKTQRVLSADDRLLSARFFDITLSSVDGEKLQPLESVGVSVELAEPMNHNTRAVHFVSGGQPQVLPAELTDGAVTFKADGFSVYGVADTVAATVISAEGERFLIEVKGGELPEDASLEVEQLLTGSDAYESCLDSMLRAREADGVRLTDVRLFDISIMSGGEKWEPTRPLQVTIRYFDPLELNDLQTVESVHFLASGPAFNKSVSVSAAADGATVVRFEQDGFSVTGTVVSAESLRAGRQYMIYTKVGDDYYALSRGVSGDGMRAVLLSQGSVTANGEVQSHVYDTVLCWELGGNATDGYQFLWHNGDDVYYLRWDETEECLTVSADAPGDDARWTVSADGTVTNVADPTKTLCYDSATGIFGDTGDYADMNFAYVASVPAATGYPATLHYGYMENGEFVEFDVQPSPAVVSSGDAHNGYLIYDYDGYHYEGHTYYRTTESDTPASGGTGIQPVLRWRHVSTSYWSGYDAWGYAISTTSYGDGNFSGDVANGSHIYVVYEKDDEITQGGTPKLVESATEPEDPVFTKTSTDNHDRTRTLALSVTGHTGLMEVEKLADVIVILDTSSSMRGDMSGQGNPAQLSNQRITLAKTAINNLAQELLAKENSNGDKLIRMALIPFDATIGPITELTDDVKTFTDDVNKFSYDADYRTDYSETGNYYLHTGTNWEAALLEANTMEVDPDRATFVIFVTDGQPSFRVSRGNYTDEELSANVPTNVPGSNNGTSPDINNEYYVDFALYGGLNEYERNYQVAEEVARAIVGAGKNFYSIGISNDVTNLDSLVEAAGVDANHSKTVSTEEELNQAFADIQASISGYTGYSSINIDDGITSLTSTVRKTGLLELVDDDFQYYKGNVDHYATQADVDNHLATSVGDPIVLNWTEWDPASENADGAIYNPETGAVEWHMGDNFMPQDDVTYEVRFKVWPSQEAYDIIAQLNNGTLVYEDLEEDIQVQIGGSLEDGYYLITNEPDAGWSYKHATKTGNTITPVGEPIPGTYLPVENLVLTTKELSLTKHWYNNIDSRDKTPTTLQLVALGGEDDDVVYHTVYVHDDNNWTTDDSYVSFGLMTCVGNNVTVYEKGHDFTIKEVATLETHYWELEASVYHPMVVNSVDTILILISDNIPQAFQDDPDLEYWNDSNGAYASNQGNIDSPYTGNYYRIGGKVYLDSGTDVILRAVNNHRSYLDVTKTVLGEEDASDEWFTISGLITVPTTVDNYDTVEKYVFFSLRNPNAPAGQSKNVDMTTVVSTGTLSPDAPGVDQAELIGQYLIVQSGVPFTFKVQKDWNARFLNLVSGTTFTFGELVNSDSGDFIFDHLTITETHRSEDDEPVTTELGTSTEYTIDGEITAANVAYKVTVYNKPQPQELLIHKVNGITGESLAGAEFTVRTVPGGAFVTTLTTDGSGKIAIEKTDTYNEGILYQINESAPPTGFIDASGGAVLAYFYFSDSDTPPTTPPDPTVPIYNLYREHGSEEVENMPTGALYVRKQWEGVIPETLPNVTVRLERYVPPATQTYTIGEIRDYSNNSNYTVRARGITVREGSTITFTITCARPPYVRSWTGNNYPYYPTTLTFQTQGNVHVGTYEITSNISFAVGPDWSNPGIGQTFTYEINEPVIPGGTWETVEDNVVLTAASGWYHSWDSLTPGSYRVIETKIGSNDADVQTDYLVTYTVDGVTYYDPTDYSVSEDKVITITNKSTAVPELPASGAAGVLPLWGTGAMLAVPSAGVLLLKRHRKRGGGRSS